MKNLNLINNLCPRFYIDASIVRKCIGIGRKLEEKDNIQSQTRPLRITLEIVFDAEVMMKSLSKLKYSEDHLRNVKKSPDGSLKERNNFKFFEQRPKNLTLEQSKNSIQNFRSDRIPRVKKRDVNVP